MPPKNESGTLMTSAHGQRDHQEGEAAQNPVAPGAHAQKRRDDGKQQSKPRDGGGVVAGEAGDEVLCASLLLRGVFHQLKDAADSRLAEGLLRADAQHAGHVHATADDVHRRLPRGAERTRR